VRSFYWAFSFECYGVDIIDVDFEVPSQPLAALVYRRLLCAIRPSPLPISRCNMWNATTVWRGCNLFHQPPPNSAASGEYHRS